MAHRQAGRCGFTTLAGLQERQHALHETGQVDRAHAVAVPFRRQQTGQLSFGGQSIQPRLLFHQLLHRALQHHVVGQGDLRQPMPRRREFKGGFAGAGIVQQGFLRWQGHAVACSAFGQFSGRFVQTFGVVAVHGRSGRLHRRVVD
ncbi:hypothetical protein D3C72_1195900 [compost metagenome]